MIPKTFIMYMGYVESSLPPCLILRHRIGFNTVIEALRDLGAAFCEAYKVEEKYNSRLYLHKCCEGQTSNYCPECGSSLQPYIIDEDKLETVAYQYMTLQAHESNEYWERLEGHGWNHFVFEQKSNPFKDGYVVITECDSKIAQAYFGNLQLNDDDYIIVRRKK